MEKGSIKYDMKIDMKEVLRSKQNVAHAFEKLGNDLAMLHLRTEEKRWKAVLTRLLKAALILLALPLIALEIPFYAIRWIATGKEAGSLVIGKIVDL